MIEAGTETEAAEEEARIHGVFEVSLTRPEDGGYPRLPRKLVCREYMNYTQQR